MEKIIFTQTQGQSEECWQKVWNICWLLPWGGAATAAGCTAAWPIPGRAAAATPGTAAAAATWGSVVLGFEPNKLVRAYKARIAPFSSPSIKPGTKKFAWINNFPIVFRIHYDRQYNFLWLEILHNPSGFDCRLLAIAEMFTTWLGFYFPS